MMDFRDSILRVLAYGTNHEVRLLIYREAKRRKWSFDKLKRRVEGWHGAPIPVDSYGKKRKKERKTPDKKKKTNVSVYGKNAVISNTGKVYIRKKPIKDFINTTGLCLCGCGKKVSSTKRAFVKSHGNQLKSKYLKLNRLLEKIVKNLESVSKVPEQGDYYASVRWPDVYGKVKLMQDIINNHER